MEPIDDPELVVQWYVFLNADTLPHEDLRRTKKDIKFTFRYLNGEPVAASSRVKMISDFGWIILDINQTEPRDSGEWTCVATNAMGEATCSATLNISGKESIVLNSLQPQSLDRIREIEAVKPAPEEAPPRVSFVYLSFAIYL